MVNIMTYDEMMNTLASSNPWTLKLTFFCWLGHLKVSFYYPTSHK